MKVCILVYSLMAQFTKENGSKDNFVDGIISNMLGHEETAYFDSITGARISQAQYFGNKLCDTVKEISPYVYTISIGIGVLLFILFRKSGKVRKLSVCGFITGLPLIWYSMAYFLFSFMVDHFIF